jgi:acetyl-CoA C-acetyltransferase
MPRGTAFFHTTGEKSGLAMAGGVESMIHVQVGLRQNLSDWLRRIAQARGFGQRIKVLSKLRPSDIGLYVPQVKNRATGRSMGEHCEDMAKTWSIGRQEQDELALESHRRAVAAQDRGFFADLVIPVDGITHDGFPRRDTSLDKLAELKPVFDPQSGRGTLTAGNSSPLTDGAAPPPARILSQAVKELAAMPSGSRAIVSICADGGQGTVALLENCGS